jgi:hypothetical protein
MKLSEYNEEDILESSDDPGQPQFSESDHHTIPRLTINSHFQAALCN